MLTYTTFRTITTYDALELVSFSPVEIPSFFGEQLRLFSFLDGELCPLLTSLPFDLDRELQK